ncbi:MAG: dihydrodipicolinate synthase family protein [Mangrovibacterium sp.]|nr:dihydrodipicolinate synthase family protein [Mangrovibacterium sp.]
MEIKKIEGLIVPVFTPMDENGEPVCSKIEEYVRFLKERHVNGVFVCGSSGEGMLMSSEERKQVTEAWARHASGSFKLIAHISAANYKDAQDLARHAQGCGAYAVASMGPVFLRPKTVDDLVGYCAKIASATPGLPYYYYHIPVRTNLNFKMIDFLRQGEERIPNLAGIKYTNSNMMDMLQCIKYRSGRFDILHGPDEMFLSGLAIGIKGTIGTSLNFIPGVFSRMIGLFNQGRMEEAAELQYFVTKVIDVISKNGGGIVAGKAIMGLCGIACGPCRSPLPSVSKEGIRQMKEELASIDFFDHV